MIGLCRGLAYQAYKETNCLHVWNEGWRQPSKTKPDLGLVTRERANARVFETSRRYYQLLDACRLRMRPSYGRCAGCGRVITDGNETVIFVNGQMFCSNC